MFHADAKPAVSAQSSEKERAGWVKLVEQVDRLKAVPESQP
jgi:hypothetical protein